MGKLKDWQVRINASAGRAFKNYWGHWWGKLFTVSALVTVLVTVLRIVWAEEIDRVVDCALGVLVALSRVPLSASGVFVVTWLLVLLTFILLVGVLENSEVAKALKAWINNRKGHKDREALANQVAEVVQQRDMWLKNAEEWFQRNHYGAELATFEPLPEVQHVQMLNRVHELQPRLEKAFHGAEQLWRELVTMAMNTGDKNPLYWLRDRLDRQEHQWATRAAETLEHRLKHTQFDPRPLLACTYTRYHLWRSWIVRLGDLTQNPVTQMEGYQAWKEADAKFLEDIHSGVLIPALKGVREIVDSYDQRNQPSELPAPDPSVVETEAKIRLMLNNLSDTQTEFLMLFSADTPSTARVSWNAYGAGVDLVRKGVLQGAADLFRIPAGLEELFKSTLFPTSAVLPEVRVGAERIASSVDRGSGDQPGGRS